MDRQEIAYGDSRSRHKAPSRKLVEDAVDGLRNAFQKIKKIFAKDNEKWYMCACVCVRVFCVCVCFYICVFVCLFVFRIGEPLCAPVMCIQVLCTFVGLCAKHV